MSGTTTEAKAGLIADTCALLIDENEDEARFAEDLFSHADAEDLLNYTPSELAVVSQKPGLISQITHWGPIEFVFSIRSQMLTASSSKTSPSLK